MVISNTPLPLPNPVTSSNPSLRAAPLIGTIIIGFATLETVMRDMMIAVRVREAAKAGRAPDLKFPRKVMDRANEWIRTVLPASERRQEADTFRETFRRIMDVRHNLAHNISSIALSPQNKLLVLTMNLDRPHPYSDAFRKMSIERNPEGPYDGVYPVTLYRQNELVSFTKEIRNCLLFVQDVHQAPGLPGSPPPQSS